MKIMELWESAVHDIESHWVEYDPSKIYNSPIPSNFKGSFSKEILQKIYETNSSTNLPKWACHLGEIAEDIQELLPNTTNVCKILPVLVWSYAMSFQFHGERLLYRVKYAHNNGSKTYATTMTPSQRESSLNCFKPVSWLNASQKIRPSEIVFNKNRVSKKYHDARFFCFLLNSFSDICNPYLSALLFDHCTNYLKLYLSPDDFAELELNKLDIVENADNPTFLTRFKQSVEKYNDSSSLLTHKEQFCVIMKAYLWQNHNSCQSVTTPPSWKCELFELYDNILEIHCAKKFIERMSEFNPSLFTPPSESSFDEDSDDSITFDEDFDALFDLINSEELTDEELHALADSNNDN